MMDQATTNIDSTQCHYAFLQPVIKTVIDTGERQLLNREVEDETDFCIRERICPVPFRISMINQTGVGGIGLEIPTSRIHEI
ncbi:hypothetical protein KUTeg_011956 [Tegillarca granosa]|uniref:Uncharacterized protein n=1 Tax=Tegillarca granosa TaxID=220873 RepID=A0ABQ9F1L0_TEGGR|nr:hypothetical protein KUTeg_011956 [Tegillarca granosa]